MEERLKKARPIAAVDVGSSYLRLMIGQINTKGEITILDDLCRPANLGRDAFNTGRISAQTINEVCGILKGFVTLMDEYKIKHYRAVATSGLREAANKEYVLEHIRLRANLDVEIVNNAQERFLIYKALMQKISNFREMQHRGLLAVTIGSGGLGISVYADDQLKFRQYFKIGSLRLWESISELDDLSGDIPRLMDEFLESKIYSIKDDLEMFEIKDFVGLGGDLSNICRLGKSCYPVSVGHELPKQVLLETADMLSRMTFDQMETDFHLSRNEIEMLLPSLIILCKIINLTKAEKILIPDVALRHGMLVDITDSLYQLPGKKYFQDDIVSSVWNAAERFDTDKTHCRTVQKIALNIFDETKKHHRLGEQERFYLLVASILHDIGRYIDVNQHDIQSYNIVKSIEIIGFSDREVELVANIVRYHSSAIPQPEHENYRSLDDKEKIIVSKLASILKLSEALDTTHKGYLKKIKIEKKGKDYIFKVESDYEPVLEEWNFKNAARFFEEVMGAGAVLKRKE